MWGWERTRRHHAAHVSLRRDRAGISGVARIGLNSATFDGPFAANLDGSDPQLWALSMADGSVLWQQPLDALPVKGGIALDAQQRVLVTTENGRLHCLVPQPN